jgi:hypothetical protein
MSSNEDTSKTEHRNSSKLFSKYAALANYEFWPPSRRRGRGVFLEPVLF